MFATRPLFRSRPTRSIPVLLSAPAPSRTFHASRVNSVQVNDEIPNIDLMETFPGNKVSIAKELKGKGLIIGIPAAFSPSCSNSHIPGYINHPGLKDAGQVFVVSVNDPFVMGAFAKSLDADNKSGIRFLADPHAAFTKALDLEFDGTAIFGQPRSKRYALVVEDGKVKKVHVEPDNTGVKESAVDNVLGRAW
ncbi:hypothetical protein LTR12_009888 [Friedmanniomyces endolithicus]|nr:hypothetical protein LTR74_002545 [Friedmanniomyces endolithicus]KAK1815701.1 hypothetical protein LTR12_009888 [Friedmanniomyces endolithicus]